MDSGLWTNQIKHNTEIIPPPDYDHSVEDIDGKSIEPDYDDEDRDAKEKRWRSRVHFFMFFFVLLITGLILGLVITLIRAKDQEKQPKHAMVGAMYTLYVTNREYIPAYEDKLSPEFKEVESEVCSEFSSIYDNSSIGDLYRGCEVSSLTEGSLITHAYVLFQDSPRTRGYQAIVDSLTDYVQSRENKDTGQILLGTLSVRKHGMAVHIKTKVMDDTSYKALNDLKYLQRKSPDEVKSLDHVEGNATKKSTKSSTNLPILLGRGVWLNDSSSNVRGKASLTCQYSNYWKGGVIQKLRELNTISTLAQLQAHDTGIDPNLEKRVNVERSRAGAVSYTRLIFYPVECEDAGNYICEVTGVDGLTDVAYGSLSIDGECL